MVTAAPLAAFAPTGVFQSLEFETNATTGIEGWRRFSARLLKEQQGYDRCGGGGAPCPTGMQAWRDKFPAWRRLSPAAKLIAVNHWANATVRYTDDRTIYKAADYWATPAQSLEGRGDCEDYALLKYASLRELGFAEQNLRIVVVDDLKRRIGHAVLSVRTGEGTFILDNQEPRVLRHDTIDRYAPIYSINAQGRWINIAARKLRPVKSPVPLLVSAADVEALSVVTEVGAVSANAGRLPSIPAAGSPDSDLPQRLSATAAAALLKSQATMPQSLAVTADAYFERKMPRI